LIDVSLEKKLMWQNHRAVYSLAKSMSLFFGMNGFCSSPL